MDDKTFELVIGRLERIEKQNDTQLDMLRDHHKYVEEARMTALASIADVRSTVNSHSAYFSILSWVGLPTFTAAVGYLFTKLGFK